MATINERIQYIIDQSYKGNVTAFSRDVGTTQSTIRDIVSGRLNKPSTDTINKILSVHTIKINPEWLLFGTGEIEKPTTAIVEERSSLELEMAKMKWAIEQLKENLNKVERERNEAIREAVKWQTIVEQQELIKKESGQLDQIVPHRKTG